MKGMLTLSLLSLSLLSSPMANSNHNPEPAMDKKNDGEVIAWISAIDNFEVSASDIAAKKNVDSAVKDYAAMLNDDHSKNLKQTQELSKELGDKPVQTKNLTQFESEGKDQLKQFSDDNEHFQKTFIDAMVIGHADALQKVDTDLVKKANNPKVKSLLQETRNMIAHHLETAKSIQKAM